MIRIFWLTTLSIMVCSSMKGQESIRNSLSLSDCYVLTGKLDSKNPDTFEVLKKRHSDANTIGELNVVKLDSFRNFGPVSAALNPNMGTWLCFEIPSSEGIVNSVGLFQPLLNDGDAVIINGVELHDQIEGTGFYEDIAPYVAEGPALVLIKIESVRTPEELKYLAKHIYFDYLCGLAITHYRALKNDFLGFFSTEIHLTNYLDHDIDGKLYARIFDKDTKEELDFNNNCAYSFAGKEAVIEVVFTDESHKLENKEYLLEIELVDKEKDEEVVDMINRSIKFP